jgi:hypothetical protein
VQRSKFYDFSQAQRCYELFITPETLNCATINEISAHLLKKKILSNRLRSDTMPQTDRQTWPPQMLRFLILICKEHLILSQFIFGPVNHEFRITNAKVWLLPGSTYPQYLLCRPIGNTVSHSI